MKRNPIKFYVVDAFSRKSCRGLSAAVVLTEQRLNDSIMQAIANELNLSATAFVCCASDGLANFELRYFTPHAEVEHCGHASLAAAHVLYEEGKVPHGVFIEFKLKKNVLKVAKRQDHICMEIPAQPLRPQRDVPASLIPESAKAAYIGCNEHVTVIGLPEEQDVKDFSMDTPALNDLKSLLCVTAPSSSDERDYVSRVLTPRIAGVESYLTANAHCALGPYWCKDLGKTQVTGEQLSQRGGVLHVGWQPGHDELTLSGQGVTTAKGFLLNIGH